MAVTPRLHLRAVRLRVQTDVGEVGRTLTFTKGLNVLRAGNTSGKSTTLQAIIYALGLEGMLSPRREIPLPHSMTDRVSVNGTEQVVRQSEVSLEFENASGEVVTATRQVKNPIIQDAVISVQFGPGITEPDDYVVADFFVRRSGAAQRERGFHHFLPKFLGWELPNVTYMDGSEKPLYAECLFPFFYVEQKHGWSGVQARIPSYFGIREVSKRSFEYILKLDVFERILLKQRVRSNIQELERNWRTAFTEMETTAKASGVTLSQQPKKISDSLGTEGAEFLVPLEGEWVAFNQALDRLRTSLATVDRARVRTADESSSELEFALEETERSVRVSASTLAILLEERVALKDQERQLDLRLEALKVDLERHKDTMLLVRLGSRHAQSLTVDHTCPTCHQEVHDGMDISHHVMTIEENVRFIERQRATFIATLSDVQRALESLDVRIRGLRNALSEQRRQVRQLKDTLTGPGNAPSLADIARRAALESQLGTLQEHERALQGHREKLHELAKTHSAQAEILESLSDTNLSPTDRAKLSSVERYLREQLRRYHFDSLQPEDVDISRETYRPSHEGYELGFDLSASDMIRVIWSYLFATMRVSEEYGGNHLGLLIFDEPKQQETAAESYSQLLHEAAEQGQRGSQIIFATSESMDSLTQMLGTAAHNLIDIPQSEKVLKLL